MDRSILGQSRICPTLPAAFTFNDLCLILPKVQDLFQEAAGVFEPRSVRYEKTLRTLLGKAVALRSELLVWASTQHTKPVPYKRFTQPYSLRFEGAEELICPVLWADTYNDCKYMHV